MVTLLCIATIVLGRTATKLWMKNSKLGMVGSILAGGTIPVLWAWFLGGPVFISLATLVFLGVVFAVAFGSYGKTSL